MQGLVQAEDALADLKVKADTKEMLLEEQDRAQWKMGVTQLQEERVRATCQ